MIIGIGIDIVSISRIRIVYEKFNSKFLDRILTSNEMLIFHQLSYDTGIKFCAKRFAAKEACAKALGCGIGANISFTDIEIQNNSFGAPSIIYNDKIHQVISNLMQNKNGLEKNHESRHSNNLKNDAYNQLLNIATMYNEHIPVKQSKPSLYVSISDDSEYAVGQVLICG